MSVRKMLLYNLPGIYYLIVAIVLPYSSKVLLSRPSCVVSGDFYTCGSGWEAIILLILVFSVGGAVISQFVIWFSLIVMFLRRLQYKNKEDNKSVMAVVFQYFVIGVAIAVMILFGIVYFLIKNGE